MLQATYEQFYPRIIKTRSLLNFLFSLQDWGLLSKRGKGWLDDRGLSKIVAVICRKFFLDIPEFDGRRGYVSRITRRRVLQLF
tara:strand:+ start:342 stop:590 length:249 start_codon:yes stop_codon:yes gene_type:complete